MFVYRHDGKAIPCTRYCYWEDFADHAKWAVGRTASTKMGITRGLDDDQNSELLGALSHIGCIPDDVEYIALIEFYGDVDIQQNTQNILSVAADPECIDIVSVYDYYNQLDSIVSSSAVSFSQKGLSTKVEWDTSRLIPLIAQDKGNHRLILRKASVMLFLRALSRLMPFLLDGEQNKATYEWAQQNFEALACEKIPFPVSREHYKRALILSMSTASRMKEKYGSIENLAEAAVILNDTDDIDPELSEMYREVQVLDEQTLHLSMIWSSMTASAPIPLDFFESWKRSSSSRSLSTTTLRDRKCQIAPLDVELVSKIGAMFGVDETIKTLVSGKVPIADLLA